MTLGELRFLLYLAAVGLAGAVWAGTTYGALYCPAGFIAGVLAAVLIPTVFVTLPWLAFLALRGLWMRRGDHGRKDRAV